MSRRGVALPLALLVLVALGFVAMAAAHVTLTAGRIAVNFDAYGRAIAAAQGALDRGVEDLALRQESGRALPDSFTLATAESLGGFVYTTVVRTRREPPRRDLNRNGIRGEVIRYERAWGFSGARAPGPPGARGEPVRVITAVASRGSGMRAMERLQLEVALEPSPAAAAGPGGRGSWRVIALHWSSLNDVP